MTNKTSDHQESVTKFFDGYAQDFHNIYGRQENDTFGGWVDRLTRKGMLRRFEETLNECVSVDAKSLLDVGSGPGIHDVILAEKLGIEILGLDIAPNMVEIARENTKKHDVEDLCEYKMIDFMSFESDRKYDVSLSLGVVEYIEEPSKFIKKMVDHSNKRALFSLPVKWNILTPQRVIRYKMRKCPLMFYSLSDIAELMSRSGVSKYRVKKVNRDYLVIIEIE